ncbi:MAG TPA: hypothetical protein VET85_17640 [Stellaceae bacterium]|nr:hypothetical protein [Stellaceae bacterium]
MTTITERLAIAAALMLMASNGFAQNAPATQSTGTTTTPKSASTGTSPTSTAGAFDSLSPGNQKIARALFLSQHPTTDGPAPLSLNQIAALKGTEGWGVVFKQMKAEGLTQAKNLGQVVSHYEHHLHDVEHARSTTATFVTKGDGRVVSTGSTHEHHGAAHDDDATADRTAMAGGAGSEGHHDSDSMAVASSGGTTTGAGVTHGSGASSASAGHSASAGGGYAHGH